MLPGLEGEKAVARWWAELKTGLPSSIGGRFQCRSRLRDHGDKGYLLMGSAAAIAAVKNPPPLRQTAIEVGCRGARSGRAMLLRSDAIEERCWSSARGTWGWHRVHLAHHASISTSLSQHGRSLATYADRSRGVPASRQGEFSSGSGAAAAAAKMRPLWPAGEVRGLTALPS